MEWEGRKGLTKVGEIEWKGKKELKGIGCERGIKRRRRWQSGKGRKGLKISKCERERGIWRGK